MSQLRLSLLGGFSATLDNLSVIGFESDKVRVLLAYLALEADRPHRRETLVTLLWPELSGQRARHNLRQALYNLRNVIGDHKSNQPYLSVTPLTIQFNSSNNTWLDVTVFTQAISFSQAHQHDQLAFCDSCLGRLDGAARLYKGRFLRGITLKGCQEMNEWSMVTAQHIHNQAVGVLSRLVSIHYDLGETESMYRYAKEWVALEHFDEAAHRAIMIALAMNRQLEAALNQYEICRDLFITELSVDLDAETHQVYEHLLAVRRGDEILKF